MASGHDAPSMASWGDKQLTFDDGTASRNLLSSQRNKGETARNKLIQQRDVLNRGILGVVHVVRYGTFKGQRAVLLVLKFVFDFNRDAFRFKKAKITVSSSAYTSTSAKQTAQTTPPVLISYSPGSIYGHILPESKEIGYEIGSQVSAAGGPASIGADAKVHSNSSYTKEHALEIVGIPDCDDEAQDFNTAIFSISETKKADFGIPRIIHVGVLVSCPGNLQCSVGVDVAGFYSWPWQRDDPLLLLSPYEKGMEPRVREFEHLTDDDWKALVPYEGERIDRVVSQA